MAAGTELVNSAARAFSSSYWGEKKAREKSRERTFSSTAFSSSSLSLSSFQEESLTLSLLRRPFMFSGKKMKMKLSDKPTKWSESLDLTGNYLTGVAEVEGKKKKEKKEEKEEEKEEKEKEENELYGFGVNIHTAPAPYWRTKIVTIKPHILFVNLTSFPLLCSQSIGFFLFIFSLSLSRLAVSFSLLFSPPSSLFLLFLSRISRVFLSFQLFSHPSFPNYNSQPRRRESLSLVF